MCLVQVLYGFLHFLQNHPACLTNSLQHRIATLGLWDWIEVGVTRKMVVSLIARRPPAWHWRGHRTAPLVSLGRPYPCHGPPRDFAGWSRCGRRAARLAQAPIQASTPRLAPTYGEVFSWEVMGLPLQLARAPLRRRSDSPELGRMRGLRVWLVCRRYISVPLNCLSRLGVVSL